MGLGLAFCPGLLWGQTVDELRHQVGRLISDYRFDEALQTARAGLELFPGQPHLQVAVGLLNLRTGNPQEGERLLRRALARPDLEGELLQVIGEAKLAGGDYESAIDVLKRASRLLPSEGRIPFLLAHAYFESGQDEAALASIEKAVRLDEKTSHYRSFYAMLLDRSGRREEAHQQIRQAQGLAPFDARLLLDLADRERGEGRLSNAFEYLELAVEADPENPLYRRELAAVAHSLGMEEIASAQAQRAVELEQGFLAYSESLILASRDRLDEAIACLEPVVDAQPEFVTGATLLAHLFGRKGEFEKALEIYDTVVAKSPRPLEGNPRAWLLLEKGDLGAALESLYATDPLNPNVFLLEGYQKQLEGKWDEAMAYFSKAEASYPLEPAVLRQMSLCLSSVGKPQEALDYLQKAYRIRPGDPEIEREARRIRFEYGLHLEEEGKWGEALQVFDRLVVEEEAPDYLFHRAYAYQKKGRFEEAVSDYEFGLRLQPESEWARVNLANCYYYVSRYEDASRQWEYLLEKFDKPQFRYELGLSLIRRWKLDEGWGLVRESAQEGYEPAQRLLTRAGVR